MDDLALTKACAEAMGFVEAASWKESGRIFLRHLDIFLVPNGGYNHGAEIIGTNWLTYDPLHDDVQCFALIEKLKLAVEYFPLVGEWAAIATGEPVRDPDIRRAIVLCVASLRRPSNDQTDVSEEI